MFKTQVNYLKTTTKSTKIKIQKSCLYYFLFEYFTDEGAGDCRDEKCQEQSMPMLTAEEVNLSSMENKVNNRKRKLVIYGCAGGALSIIVLVATIVITILVVRHYDAASIGGSGGSCASAAECKKGLWCVNSKCAKSDIALSDDKADGICERGCSDVKVRQRCKHAVPSNSFSCFSPP